MMVAIEEINNMIQS